MKTITLTLELTIEELVAITAVLNKFKTPIKPSPGKTVTMPTFGRTDAEIQTYNTTEQARLDKKSAINLNKEQAKQRSTAEIKEIIDNYEKSEAPINIPLRPYT